MTREENLKTISNLLSPKAVNKIVAKNYSNDVLEYISGYAPTAETFAYTRYQPQTVEKLMGLMREDKIDSYDMMELMEDSLSHNRNEQYINKFAETVCMENHHDTYAVFRTTNVTDVSFDDMYLGIYQGIYEANNIGVVQMNKDLAREMHDLGISLLVCEEYDHYYDLLDFDNAYNEDIYTFIPVQKHRLASAINDMRWQPDWSDFKEYLKNKIYDMDRLTPYILEQKYNDFQVDNGLSKLADKVAGEYEKYIADLKQGDPDRIIKSAYEIYNKDYIVDFCNTNITSLSPDDLQVLLDTDNVLDEIYQEWDTMTQLHGVAEIDTAIEDTAYRLRTAQAVKQMMEQKQKQELTESKVIADKPGVPKPIKLKRR
ncbi:MAG: DUF3848 domain-containing protein [Ruminococcus sp.]|nr:DUF3848 domain-containing protein [Ruminococcus sp.]